MIRGKSKQYEKSDQRHWTLKCPSCGTWTALDKEFPVRLGEEVRIILPLEDGSFYRACPECQGELDPDQGEWVADWPDRPIHGYRISQLFSSTVDPGEILQEYRTTRFPDRFFNLKIGIAWADLERRLDAASVLALCSQAPLETTVSRGSCSMGVDTGRDLHVVILRTTAGGENPVRELVHLEVCHEFGDLDRLLERFQVQRCVIDGLPETHATREFAQRHPDRVFMNFFQESQRGGPRWDQDGQIVQINRTEALDASRAAVRDQRLVLPPRSPDVEMFAQHLSCDAKVLDEDAETGIKKYRYVRTGANHLSMAFTYAWLAAMQSDGCIRSSSDIQSPASGLDPDWEMAFATTGPWPGRGFW